VKSLELDELTRYSSVPKLTEKWEENGNLIGKLRGVSNSIDNHQQHIEALQLRDSIVKDQMYLIRDFTEAFEIE